MQYKFSFYMPEKKCLSIIFPPQRSQSNIHPSSTHRPRRHPSHPHIPHHPHHLQRHHRHPRSHGQQQHSRNLQNFYLQFDMYYISL